MSEYDDLLKRLDKSWASPTAKEAAAAIRKLEEQLEHQKYEVKLRAEACARHKARVAELEEGLVIVSRERLEKMEADFCFCHEAYTKRDMVDPNCAPIHDVFHALLALTGGDD